MRVMMLGALAAVLTMSAGASAQTASKYYSRVKVAPATAAAAAATPPAPTITCGTPGQYYNWNGGTIVANTTFPDKAAMLAGLKGWCEANGATSGCVAGEGSPWIARAMSGGNRQSATSIWYGATCTSS